MGIGSSGMQSQPRQKRRHPSSKYGSYGGKKQQRGPLRGHRPRSPPQVVPYPVPIKQRPHQRYAYGSYPYIQHVPAYAPVSQPQAYSGYMPVYQINYPNAPNTYPRQPAMVPQQMPQSVIAPSPVPLYQPGMMPQQVPMSQPMSRQVPLSMFPPYMYPSAAAYPTGVPYSAPYAQPAFNNVVSSPSYSPGGGIASPNFAASNSYNLTSGQLSTDWTGGGKISPGFLGPPI